METVTDAFKGAVNKLLELFEFLTSLLPDFEIIMTWATILYDGLSNPCDLPANFMKALCAENEVRQTHGLPILSPPWLTMSCAAVNAIPSIPCPNPMKLVTEVMKHTKQLMSALVSSLSTAIGPLQDALRLFMDGASAVWDETSGIRDVVSGFVGHFQTLFDRFTTLWNQIQLSQHLVTMKNHITSVTSTVTNVISLDNLISIANTAASAISALTGQAASQVSALTTNPAQMFSCPSTPPSVGALVGKVKSLSGAIASLAYGRTGRDGLMRFPTTLLSGIG
jgi:hypothetical protein